MALIEVLGLEFERSLPINFFGLEFERSIPIHLKGIEIEVALIHCVLFGIEIELEEERPFVLTKGLSSRNANVFALTS